MKVAVVQQPPVYLDKAKSIERAVELIGEAARQSRRKFDVCAHYARPDVFTLKVNCKRQVPVVFG